ncbi:fumarate hydratase, partial [Candidatus Nomurabacteria bacterium]|nr:fumarate hydratase [Candidatus Nomurabacteria bacterium]
MTRVIECRLVTELVASLCIEANIILPADIADVISSAEYREVSPEGMAVLADLKLNMTVARKERIPICQDTGMAVVFVKIGQEVQISGGALT